jgi:carboxymethylenebutenolidase
MYHFGTADQSIPLSDVAQAQAARPEGTFYLYEGAGHGFNCEQRPSYSPEHAALARQRTLEFFARYVAGTDKATS